MRSTLLAALVVVLIAGLSAASANAAEPENTLIIELETGAVEIALRPDLAPQPATAPMTM